jgi:CRP-like cAMP-binding protein
MNSENSTQSLLLPSLPKELELIGNGSENPQQITAMMQRMQLFSQSSLQDIELIARFCYAYRAPANTTLLREGVKERMLWFLVDGEVRVEKRDEDGINKQLATIGGGRTLGEVAFIDELPHSASVGTVSDSTLLLLTRDNFLKMAASSPRQSMNLAWLLAQQLCQRLRQTSDILIDYL